MPAKLNLLGQVFGSLTAIEELDHNIVNGNIRKGHYYRCSCKCGGESIVAAGHLRRSVRECVKCPTNNLKLELEGKVFSTKQYGDFKVLRYTDSRNIDIQFIETGYVTTSHIKEVRTGHIKDPIRPSVHGVGYVGIGPHRCTIAESSRINSPAYEIWSGMIKRCYSENTKVRSKTKSYRGVTVCKEWHNFQNFAEWCYKQEGFSSKDEKGKSYHIDKDILVRGNKIYSPETCCFVPRAINNLLILKSRYRGELPIGVSKCFSKRAKSFKYIGLVNINGVQKNVGRYDTPEDAFKAYKEAKESYVKEVAERYKSSISIRAYNELLKYEVSIDD